MSLVEIERQPDFRTVRLTGGRGNALTLDAIEALKVAIAPDPVLPVVVLRGRRDAFCAGLDNAMLAESERVRETLLAAMGELLQLALSGPTRIVSVCEGHAVAAGAMLLLVSDVRIGVPGKHQIGFTEPRLGMPLPELPALLARERLDRRRLHELTVLGRTLAPGEAAAAGFLDAVVSPNELEATVAARARAVGALSESAYGGSLRAVWGSTLERIEALVTAQRRRRDAAVAAQGV